MAAEHNITIIDYVNRLIPDSSGSMNPCNEQVLNMDFASLYPTPMRKILYNSVIGAEIAKTTEELIENWEYEQESTLRADEFSFFPEMQQIAARTLGQDLVHVQPMPQPQGILHYMDYVYEPEEPECPIQNVIESIQKQEESKENKSPE